MIFVWGYDKILQMRDIFCGIDFGTTNSVIALTDGRKVSLVPLENEKKMFPTAIFCSKTDRLFGQRAIDAYMQGEEGRFMRSMKRILGTDLMNATTLINGKQISFDSLIAAFLKEIKTRAENYIHSEITSVVLGRPVHYQDNMPEADAEAEGKMREISKKVGFKEIVFQYEPIAAAFAHEQNLSQNKIALVADLGGGTSDFTIMRIGPNYRQKSDRKDDILATSGIRVGGNDFDKDLSVNSFMPQFGKGTSYGTKNLPVPEFLFSQISEWSKINFMYTPKNLKMIKDILLESHNPECVENLLLLLEMQQAHQLLQVVEQAKIDLTNQEQVKTFFDNLGKHLNFEIESKVFEKVVQQECNKIIFSIKECLSNANLEPDKIELLILTGGTSQIPLVQKSIRRLFPKALISDKQKMESVALGLAHMAEKVF